MLMTKADEQDRYSCWIDESHRHHNCSGNVECRTEVQQSGLGASNPAVPRHQLIEHVSRAGKPFHGTVGQLIRDQAQASHEECLGEIEHAGPEWLQRRLL